MSGKAMRNVPIPPRVLADGLTFPEGPAFAADGGLWGVEMNAGRLFRWQDGVLARIEVGGKPNGLAIREDRIFFCDAGRDAVFRLDQFALQGIAESTPEQALTAPNDLIFDARGVMIFTCPGSSTAGAIGSVWARSAEGVTRGIAEQMHFPNGLSLTPDGTDLIVAETLGQRLWRGRWDSENLSWVDPRPWTHVGGAPLGPDGMAFAPDGLLYVALYGSGQVLAINDDGLIVRAITVPGIKPTNLAFDPSGRLGMIVTEASNGLLLSYPAVGDA